MKVCNRGKVDRAVDIPVVVGEMLRLAFTDNSTLRQQEHPCQSERSDRSQLPSLAVDFCGVRCENPFVLGSSVISNSYEMCSRALDVGWDGVSVKTISLFDIEEVSPRFDIHSPGKIPFIGFKNLEQLSPNSAEFDFAWMKKLKETYPSKLIIASIL